MKNKFIKWSRLLIRRILKISPNESIPDGISRKVYRIRKKWDKRELTIAEFEQCLRDAGVQAGDTLIVHASWRGCYMLKTSPEEVIRCILQYLGPEGTLLMPCYGDSGENLDVKNTPSQAGVLSECYRRYKNVMRSQFPQGTMCGSGKKAHKILCEHRRSKYGYDEHSPYYKAIMECNAKILLLGMGRKPHKITAFHCATYASRENVEFYGNVYRKIVNACLIDENNVEHRFGYVDRIKPYSNNCRKFKRLFKDTKHVTIKKKGLIMITFNGMDAYQSAKGFCERGGKLYLTR